MPKSDDATKKKKKKGKKSASADPVMWCAGTDAKGKPQFMIHPTAKAAVKSWMREKCMSFPIWDEEDGKKPNQRNPEIGNILARHLMRRKDQTTRKLKSRGKDSHENDAYMVSGYKFTHAPSDVRDALRAGDKTLLPE